MHRYFLLGDATQWGQMQGQIPGAFVPLRDLRVSTSIGQWMDVRSTRSGHGGVKLDSTGSFGVDLTRVLRSSMYYLGQQIVEQWV
jgi:hypothetical protein